jgi:hypothetical protein
MKKSFKCTCCAGYLFPMSLKRHGAMQLTDPQANAGRQRELSAQKKSAPAEAD